MPPNIYFNREINSHRALLLLAALLAFGAIGGALYSEYALGYIPCPLCLRQRWPYYLAFPVFAWVLGAGHKTRLHNALVGVLLGLFIVSTGLGVHHAGVEWGFWAGPADCALAGQSVATSLEAFRASLDKARVVLCDKAALRVLGLSFAGWNAVVSAGITGLLVLALQKGARPQ